MKQLNLQNLQFAKNYTTIKAYPKSERIAHFGVGNFHRSHQCQYNDQTMQITKDESWGILGVGIKQFDVKMNKVLLNQNCLFSLMIKQKQQEDKIKIIKSIVDHIDGFNNPFEAIHRVANKQIQIISMTITEGGYNINKNTGKFDQNNLEIQQDLKRVAALYNSLKKESKVNLENLNQQLFKNQKFNSVFPYLFFSILIHKKNNHPITILSCDNIQHNGNIIKRSLTFFITLIDKQLATWVNENCKFPNCMVDRITPQTSQNDVNKISQILCLKDEWPVCCQSFKQWIIQDQFANDIRPKWQLSGVTFVKDVVPYQKIKLRLLNATHQAISYLGFIKGYKYVHEAAQDPLIKQMALKYMKEQVQQTLDKVKDINIDQYQRTIIKRFSNQKILDTLSRICQYTTDRIPLFNLSSSIQIIKKNSERRLPITSLIISSWIRYLEQQTENGLKYAIVDNRKEQLYRLRKKINQTQDPLAFLIQMKDLFGILSQNETFLNSVKQSYFLLKKEGVNKSIEIYLQK